MSFARSYASLSFLSFDGRKENGKTSADNDAHSLTVHQGWVKDGASLWFSRGNAGTANRLEAEYLPWPLAYTSYRGLVRKK